MVADEGLNLDFALQGASISPMRKLVVTIALLLLATGARSAFAQGKQPSRGFVTENIQPLGASAAPESSQRDWVQSSESKAQTKWRRGGFGKKGKFSAKGKKTQQRRPAKRPQIKKP